MDTPYKLEHMASQGKTSINSIEGYKGERNEARVSITVGLQGRRILLFFFFLNFVLVWSLSFVKMH